LSYDYIFVSAVYLRQGLNTRQHAGSLMRSKTTTLTFSLIVTTLIVLLAASSMSYNYKAKGQQTTPSVTQVTVGGNSEVNHTTNYLP